jgi:hypothetical protein
MITCHLVLFFLKTSYTVVVKNKNLFIVLENLVSSRLQMTLSALRQCCQETWRCLIIGPGIHCKSDRFIYSYTWETWRSLTIGPGIHCKSDRFIYSYTLETWRCLSIGPGIHCKSDRFIYSYTWETWRCLIIGPGIHWNLRGLSLFLHLGNLKKFNYRSWYTL